MTTADFANLSQVLLWPWTIVVLVAAMLLHFHALAWATDRFDGSRPWSAPVATAATALGFGFHVAHLVTRSLAAGGRVPWGNMFEFSSTAAALIIGASLLLGRNPAQRALSAFLVLGGLVTLGAGVVLWTPPGPLMPILNSQWLKIHVFTVVLGFATFSVGAVLSGLHLIRHSAESRLVFTARSLGAAAATDLAQAPADAVRVIDPVPTPADVSLRAIAWTVVAATAAGSVFLTTRPVATVALAVIAAAGALAARRFVGALPTADAIERTAHRVITFGFPVWTFAIIAGAIWAEQSWGRYWGWDPKETSAFLTWIAYAGYLHARATRGISRVRSSQLALVAFAVLWFTYFVVNLFITGLHSYAGLQ